MKLGERILAIVDYHKLTVPKYADNIGVKTAQGLRDLINGKTKTLSQNMKDKILSYSKDINPVWLLTGEGSMLKNSDEAEDFDESEEIDVFDNVPNKYISYLVPLAAMGGSLAGFEEAGVGRNMCERIVSPVANIDWVVPVCGDSMEPEYPNGSHVYVREINHFDFIAWGHVYVLDTTNGIIIKVVEKSDEPECVRCVSLNPSGRYSPFDVPVRTIRRMYKVVLCATLK